MWRDFIAQAAGFGRFIMGLHLPEEEPQLFLQQFDLLLLPIHRTIEFFEQIFVQTRFDFQLGQSVFHGMPFRLGTDAQQVQWSIGRLSGASADVANRRSPGL